MSYLDWRYMKKQFAEAPASQRSAFRQFVLEGLENHEQREAALLELEEIFMNSDCAERQNLR